jgi:hypothetical protein
LSFRSLLFARRSAFLSFPCRSSFGSISFHLVFDTVIVLLNFLYNKLLWKLSKFFANVQNTVVQKAKYFHEKSVGWNRHCHTTTNFKLDQSVSAIHDSPPYFWDQWGWPPTEPLTVTHARDIWWTLDFANAFVSPGVNSRGELVPSHGALRRRLGD